MSPRARLTLSSAAVMALLGMIIPAQAGSASRTAEPFGPVVAGDQQQAPKEQQAPRPAPNGCPFRDGKLELIA